MNKEIIIDRYGKGHAVIVLREGKIIDSYIDPPSSFDFYPPDTFVRAQIDRDVSKIGGYFVKLPNGNQGFLKTKNKYIEGVYIVLLSKVIYEPLKQQAFSDVLKTVSKYFIIKIGKTGAFFSKNLKKSFDKFRALELLHLKIKNLNDISVIFRSSTANLSFQELGFELEKAIAHIQKIKNAIDTDHVYYDGLARQVSLKKFEDKSYNILEDEGIFERLGLWDKIEEIKEGRIPLNKGSYLIFEQTSAFLTIDVNSGNDFKITKKQINLSACDEICRIIKAFGFGGKILIDFLPCTQDLREEIYRRISIFFGEESIKSKIWGWTKSGIFELERRRDKIPLKLLV